MLDSSYAELLTTLHSAPLEPELWGDFMRRFCDLTGVSKAGIISHHAANKDHRILATVADEVLASVEDYQTTYWQFDQWTSRFPRTGVAGRVVCGEEIWSSTDLVKSSYYNEFLLKFDTCQMACIAAAESPGVFETLSIYRGPREAEFDSQKLALLEMLSPHLQVALLTRRRLVALEVRVSDLESAFNTLETALILLDAKGKCVLVNRAAQLILDQRSGLIFDRSRLHAFVASESMKLAAGISLATSRSPDRVLVESVSISRPGRRPLKVTVSPLRPTALGMIASVAAIVFLCDPEQTPFVSGDALQLLYGLTRAETRLALMLFNGKTLAEAAETQGVGRETVRSQIKSIFQKTGTRRQAELIRLLGTVS